MKLGYTKSQNRGEVDRILAQTAAALMAAGLKLAGVVQTNSENCDIGLCDMDVRVLPDGPVFRISQSLGKEAKGCRLDPGALEQAVGAVAASLEDGPDLLIINKFGKHEADGRGFRPLIAEALARNIPVVLGVSKLSQRSFDEFTGGAATYIAPNEESLMAWFQKETSHPAKAGS